MRFNENISTSDVIIYDGLNSVKAKTATGTSFCNYAESVQVF